MITPEIDQHLGNHGTRDRANFCWPPSFVLALAFFERSSYEGVWSKLTAGLGNIVVAHACASSLSRARRRLGVAPLRALFTVLAGPVATPAQTCAFYRGRRVVAIDGTTLNAPDEPAVTWRYPKHIGPVREFGYQVVTRHREW
ncbi:transposase domain-containing protein [Streptomyces rochei]|uniref:transposase domain-containing protein n=1 Tax=Streptomyces rochei TaxID=1928 RepID=UPI003530FEF6